MTAQTLAVLVIRGISPVLREWFSNVLERVAALEARELPVGQIGPRGPEGQAGPRGLDGPEGQPGRDGRDGQFVQGEKGEQGTPGAPGINGKDGRDGTLKDLKVEYDGLRTVSLCFKNGDPVEGGVIVFPIVIDQGVYKQGTGYVTGDGTTWGGSWWIAQRNTTAKPGEPDSGWRLAVKKGADGKPGPPGPEGRPGQRGEQGPQGRSVY